MVRRIKKDVYTDYVIELNEYDLGLIIKGLIFLDKKNEEDPERPNMSYEGYLLQELREIKEKVKNGSKSIIRAKVSM